MNQTTKQVLFIGAVLLCLTPYVEPPLALLLGFVLAQTIGHPFVQHNHKATNWLLKSSVVGLGFGVNLQHALQAGREGIVFTVVSIAATFLAGWIFGIFILNSAALLIFPVIGHVLGMTQLPAVYQFIGSTKADHSL